MPVIQDDRTPEQRETHPILWIGTDRCMSGWGGAEGGASFAAWACRPDDDYRVERWVRSRRDMMRVRQAVGDYRPGASCAHLHVYVVDEGHAALR